MINTKEVKTIERVEEITPWTQNQIIDLLALNDSEFAASIADEMLADDSLVRHLSQEMLAALNTVKSEQTTA